MLNKSANGSVSLGSPQESAFATEPSTCSPCFIRDFNVQLSGSNVYQQSISYKYEHFMNELNGSQGVDANQETGTSSSLISLADYVSNYGYLVVDLSRRYDYDDNTPLSVQIQGVVASAKKLDLMCYITYTKSMTIDLQTGAKVA